MLILACVLERDTWLIFTKLNCLPPMEVLHYKTFTNLSSLLASSHRVRKIERKIEMKRMEAAFCHLRLRSNLEITVDR